MNLVGFLLRASRIKVVIAALTGFMSGTCNAMLLASLNNAVSNNSFTSQLLWEFIGLVLATFVTSFISRVLLVSLSQEAIYKLQLSLSNWILSCPLRHLEELGTNRLLATLTEDTESLKNAVFAIPFLVIELISPDR